MPPFCWANLRVASVLPSLALQHVPQNGMFHNVRNNNIRGTTSERAAAESVGRRLPPGWTSTLQPGTSAGRVLAIRAPDGHSADLAVKLRQRLGPRDVANLIREAGGNGEGILVVSPFLSPRSRELLIDAGASFVDATGNLRVAARAPALFLEVQGEDRDPDKRPRSLRSLKGATAGRVVRALCDFLPPYGVRTLAQISSTALGTVSRVVGLLEEEALLSRDDKKKITAVDWARLIERWTRDYNVHSSNRLHSYLEPRGLPALSGKLSRLERYAVTGSLAGPGIAPTRLAMIYVDDAEAAARALDLTEAEAGANVWLLEPYDEVVFERTQSLSAGTETEKTVLVAAAPSQVAADLTTSPGRGPQEAEALIEKMKGDENGWRHRP
jgi:hypothetical protein